MIEPADREFETARTKLLDAIVLALSWDDRFLAAWLAGSIGRGESDQYSDLDLWLVARDDVSTDLCQRTRTTGAGTERVRFDLLRQFGDPCVIHEHHANAPEGGTFTSVVYADSGQTVDWIIVPESIATRDPDTVVLFDHIGIELIKHLPPDRDEEVEAGILSERLAFFWLLAIPAAKSLRRGDGVRFHAILEMMYGVCRDIEATLDQRQTAYTSRSLSPFCPTPTSQRETLLAIAERARLLTVRARRAGATVLDGAELALEQWLNV